MLIQADEAIKLEPKNVEGRILKCNAMVMLGQANTVDTKKAL